MRLLAFGLAALLVSSAALAAVDPFDAARSHIKARQNEEALQLIDSGAFDVNLQTDEGYTLLHYAADAGNLVMVKALIARGADPTLKSAIGSTPYQMAIGTMVQAEIRKAMTAWAAGAPAPVNRLAAPTAGPARANPGTSGSNGMCAMARDEPASSSRSPAMRPWLKAKDAIWYNHPDELTGLLEDCVKANQQDEYGWTLLHAAAERDRVEHARILLNHGASRTLRNKDGQTPAQLATSPEMRALLGSAAAAPAPARTGRDVECQQKYQADAALASDSTGRMSAMRRWQQCLKTGLYW